MDIWIDAQISPAVAAWINSTQTSLNAKSLRSLNLLKASDKKIFFEDKKANAVILTKDQDFYQLLSLFGPPPQIIWLTSGNTSTQILCKLLENALPKAVLLLNRGEPIVEIN